ncbi:MAG TPA: hypothetical protein VMU02_12550 [bacterium]|nr:hypothetical protein [bacterium]
MVFARRHWPLLAALALLYAMTAVSLVISIRANAGHLVYALDDPYIIMATAKNLALHGVWGVTKYGFSSSSSSILWPLVLAATYVGFGVNELSPLVLNLIAAGLVVTCSYFFLRRYTRNSLFLVAALASMILFVSLPALILTGHEHLVHTLFTIWLAYWAAATLTGRRTGLRAVLGLSAVAALAISSRYEGLMLAAVVGALLLARQRLRDGLMFGVIALAPVTIFGLVSIAHGWSFLPQSVLARGSAPDVTSAEAILGGIASSIFVHPARHSFLIALLCGNLAFVIIDAIRTRGIWRDTTIMSLLFVISAILHLQVAKLGSLDRYEAYLVALGLFATAASIASHAAELGRPRADARSLAWYGVLGLIGAATVGTLVPRGWELATMAPVATTNIYEQQYQMGLFVKKFYEGRCVALNDIGAVNFLADIKCLDLWGLANREVAEARGAGTYDTARIRELVSASGAEIAILYPKWFTRFGGLPPEWTEVGEWRIRNNVICGGRAVSIYAITPSERAPLDSSLCAFSPELPEAVLQLRGQGSPTPGSPLLKRPPKGPRGNH